MTKQEQLAVIAQVFDAWVAHHAEDANFDPDNPTPEQEAELVGATVQVLGPEILGAEWVQYVDNMTDAERELLLRSPAYQQNDL